MTTKIDVETKGYISRLGSFQRFYHILNYYQIAKYEIIVGDFLACVMRGYLIIDVCTLILSSLMRWVSGYQHLKMTI